MLPQLLANALIAGSTYSLVALGFGLIYSTSRFFHFAHAAIYTVGAYAAYAFIVRFNVPFPIGIISAVAFASLLGAAMDFGFYRPLRRMGTSSEVLLLTSIGLLVVIQNTLSLAFGDDSKIIRRELIVEGISLLGARITPTQIKIVLVALISGGAIITALRYTTFGRKIRAVANDPELSQSMGINSDDVIMLTFIIGSALAGTGGILASLDTDMTPTMGLNALLMGIVALIAGGMGSNVGAILGGFLIALAQNLGVWKLPTQWQQAIVFGILLLFLILRPRGVLGVRARATGV